MHYTLCNMQPQIEVPKFIPITDIFSKKSKRTIVYKNKWPIVLGNGSTLVNCIFDVREYVHDTNLLFQSIMVQLKPHKSSNYCCRFSNTDRCLGYEHNKVQNAGCEEGIMIAYAHCNSNDRNFGDKIITRMLASFFGASEIMWPENIIHDADNSEDNKKNEPCYDHHILKKKHFRTQSMEEIIKIYIRSCQFVLPYIIEYDKAQLKFKKNKKREDDVTNLLKLYLGFDDNDIKFLQSNFKNQHEITIPLILYPGIINVVPQYKKDIVDLITKECIMGPNGICSAKWISDRGYGGAKCKCNLVSQIKEPHLNKEVKSAKQLIEPSIKPLVKPSAPPLEPNPMDINDLLCVICQSTQKSILFLPCKHICTCEVCSNKSLVSCPLCRSQISEKMKVFV